MSSAVKTRSMRPRAADRRRRKCSQKKWQTRVKMATTSNVYAIARCEGGLRYAAKEIKVTLGGCGG